MKKNSEQLINTVLSHKENYLKKELYDRIQKDHYLFEFLQEAVLDGLWFWDLTDPDNEWMNPKFWHILGYDPEEMPHKTSAWQDIIFKEDLKQVYANFAKHLQNTSSPYDQVVRYKHKLGHTVWIRCRGIVLKNEAGKAIRMLGAHTEITDIKEKERQLRLKTAFLEQVIEGSNMGTWQWNLKTNEAVFSKRLLEIIGYVEEELETTSMDFWIEKTHHKDIDKVNQQLQDHLDGKEFMFESECRINHKNGNFIWVLDKGKVVSWDDQGNPEWMVGSVQEITKNKNAYERNRLFIEQTPTGIAMLDRKMNYLAASEEWKRLFNICEDIIGKSHYDVLPCIANKWKASYQECLVKKIIKRREEKVITDKGDVQWFSWEFRPWFTDEEKVGGILIHMSDITKIKREEELQSLLKVAEDQNKRLKNFAHIVSHNLKSHSSNFEMLLDLFVQENPEAKNNQIIELFHTASEHLSETITHLNEIVLINTSVNENLSSLVLKNSIDKVIESVLLLAIENEVRVLNQVNENVEVLGISAYLDSVLLNFITNGIKYRSTDRDSFVKLYSYTENDFEVLCIEDNGLGIDLNKHESKLFGMYKTFHNHEDSRGIGLFITKNQVEAIGGKIEVSSEVDKGTIFKVYLKHE